MGKATKQKKQLRDRFPVIYCLEGVWRDDDDRQDLRSHDHSVEPMLRYLEVNRYWRYRHRDVATVSELEYYLVEEWTRCTDHSILYIATHGSPSEICLSTGKDVALSELADILKDGCDGCKKRMVHFGGCAVVSKDDKRIQRFKDKTEAAVVSGFQSNNIGWTDLELPATLAELMLFSALSRVKFTDVRRYGPKLQQIKTAMEERFDDCNFQFVI